MTYSKQITLWCDGDGCDKWSRFQTNRVATARSRADGEGWDTSRGGPDYCPRCAETPESQDTDTDR